MFVRFEGEGDGIHKRGKTKMEAASVFRLNRKTIYRWEQKQKEERLAMTKRKVYKAQKFDPEELRKYTKSNPDKTLKEMGAAFGGGDISVFYGIR
jgi:transposase